MPKNARLAAIIAEAFIMMAALQAIRELLEWVADPLTSGEFERRMVTMAVMLLLFAAVIVYARLRRTELSVFPKRFGTAYIIVTCVAAALIISAPSNFTGGYQAILLLLYGSIVTPVYEELIFRGYIWNRLSAVVSKQVFTYIWSIALFTVWHMGYMLPHILSGNWSAVLWKLAAGLGYGTVLGFIRLKTGNCYSTMLAHGILNLFMI